MVIQQHTTKFLKYKSLFCLFINVCLTMLQIYITIIAATLANDYNDYYYCTRDARNIIGNCYEIDSLPFSLYHKTQLLNVLNLVCFIMILVIYIILGTYLRGGEVGNARLIKTLTIFITMTCCLAIITNIWHVINIYSINEEEQALWNSIDTRFISQYFVVEIFVVTHICNMILVCL